MTAADPLLEIKNLTVEFATDEGVVHAVNGVDLDIGRSRVLAVVGESGCGKSVTARAVLRILTGRSKIVAGEILFHDERGKVTDLARLGGNSREMMAIRGAQISMIFQEPVAALSPVHTVGDQIAEALKLHRKMSSAEARKAAVEMLTAVGMPRAASIVDSYPYQLSGGMCQRVMIAMAMCCNPKLLIADEPTTALDVTTEAQILDLMRGLKGRFSTAILFITHNLGVVAELADEVAVMYLGRVVERCTVDQLFFEPAHPYTIGLLRSRPRIGAPQKQHLDTIGGAVPDPRAIPSGCPFHPRCFAAVKGTCDRIEPPLIEVSQGHGSRCHFAKDIKGSARVSAEGRA